MMKMTKVVIPVFLFGFLGLFIFSCSNGSGGGSGDDSYYAPATPSSSTGNSSNNGDNGEKNEDTGDDTEEIPTNYMDSPYILKAGTDGSAGTEATYVLFGEWPQTVKAQDVEITELIDQDKHLYLGSDGCKYFKMMSDNARNLPSNFSDGSIIEDKREYYFKVEPIKWHVVTNNYNETGNALLLSEKHLVSNIPYNPTYKYSVDYSSNGINYKVLRSYGNDKDIYPSDYEYSFVRAVLNGLSYISHYENQEIDSYKVASVEIKFKDNGFLQNAFSLTGQNLIETTYVKNDSSSVPDFAFGEEDKFMTCNNTNDKIFVLSYMEIQLLKIEILRLKSDLVSALYPNGSMKDINYIASMITRSVNSSTEITKNGNRVKNYHYWIPRLCGIPLNETSCVICPALTIKLD